VPFAWLLTRCAAYRCLQIGLLDERLCAAAPAAARRDTLQRRHACLAELRCWCSGDSVCGTVERFQGLRQICVFSSWRGLSAVAGADGRRLRVARRMLLLWRKPAVVLRLGG
jgi:hypothetical protein